MINRFFQKRQCVLFIIAAFSTLTTWTAYQTGVFDLIELKSYDFRLFLKAKFRENCHDVPIVLIQVDDKTLEDDLFKFPMALWHEQFATVIKGLADSHARVIALDFLFPSKSFDTIVPGWTDTWLSAFAYSIYGKGVPIIAGFYESPEQQFMPPDAFLLTIGINHCGLLNLTHDRDFRIRRQELIYPTSENRNNFSFSYLAAQAFDPTLNFEQHVISIDFVASNRLFSSFSFSDVYKRIRENKSYSLEKNFHDRIVLIGEKHALSQDVHLTPLNRMSGLEVHAHILHTLIHRHFFVETKTFFNIGIVLILTMITCGLTIYARLKHVLIGFTGLILIYTACAAIAFMNDFILPVVPAIVAPAMAMIVTFSYRFTILDKEKRKIQRIFETYLTPIVVSNILKLNESEIFTGKEIYLCILFSDIRDFTTYTRTRTFNELKHRLNEYYGAMSSVIAEHHGVLNRFFGDGLLAFFGGFNETENPSISGAKAALNMVSRLTQLNYEWQIRGEQTFRTGIGLHSGMVGIGNIGDKHRMEFTLTGDVANLASRIEAKTKELNETILISETVFQDVSETLYNAIRFEDKGEQPIKGREPVRIYAMKFKE